LPGGAGSVLNDLAFSGHFRHGESIALLAVRVRVLNLPPGIVRGIFLAVDWRHMRRIAAEIGSSDPKFLVAGVDQFPEFFGGSPSLVACRAVDAYDVGRKSVAVAAAKTSAMI
jgi:hypothetical protein